MKLMGVDNVLYVLFFDEKIDDMLFNPQNPATTIAKKN